MAKSERFTVSGSLKAGTAALTTFGASYATAVQDGSVTQPEWITIVVATLLATLAVYQVPNLPSQDQGEKAAKAALAALESLRERMDAMEKIQSAPAVSEAPVVIAEEPDQEKEPETQLAPAPALSMSIFDYDALPESAPVGTYKPPVI